MDAPADVVAFEREHDGDRLLCVVNLSPEERDVAMDDGEVLLASGVNGAHFAGYGALIARLV